MSNFNLDEYNKAMIQEIGTLTKQEKTNNIFDIIDGLNSIIGEWHTADYRDEVKKLSDECMKTLDSFVASREGIGGYYTDEGIDMCKISKIWALRHQLRDIQASIVKQHSDLNKMSCYIEYINNVLEKINWCIGEVCEGY